MPPKSVPSSSGTLSLADREVLRYVVRHKRGPYTYSVGRKIDELIDRGYIRLVGDMNLVTTMGDEAMRNA